MKAASVLLIVSSFNSVIVTVLGLVMLFGNIIEPDWIMGFGMFVLGMVGIVVFYLAMVSNMKVARLNKKAEAKK